MINIVCKAFDELSLDELYDMLRLRVEVFVLEQNCPYQDLDEKDKSAHHMLVYKKNVLIGTARLLPKGISYTDYCSIGRVCITADERRYAYGIELMKVAIEQCFQRYQCAIKISAQQYLENFYNNLGFVSTSDVYLEDNIPHIAMILKQA